MFARKSKLCATPAGDMDQPRQWTDLNDTTSGCCPAEWGVLIAQVKAGEETGGEQLYKLFCRGIRDYLCRQLGPQELDEKVHDTFSIVVEAIRRGDLRHSELLIAFIRSTACRQVARYIEQTYQSRREQADLEGGLTVVDCGDNPEQEAVIQKKAKRMKGVLSRLSQRDRDILERFYLQEQSEEQVCREMSVTETQCRLLKSRVKVNFEERSQESRR